MSHQALQRLIGTAVTDPDFCEDLLNGERPACLGEFDLTDEEEMVLLSIEASSLQEFAGRLDEWLQTQKSRQARSGGSPQGHRGLAARRHWL